MGQRLQAYIHTLNPLISFEKMFKNTPKKYWLEHPDEHKNSGRVVQKHRHALGTDKTTILCFHHQWCYGKSALLTAANVLQFNKFATEYNNPFKENYVSNSDPGVEFQR